MFNINNKSWDKLRFSDISKMLTTNDENFFIEFKSDKESNNGFIKEVSAFANTYGGYIFLGINDDKTIGGCTQWNEQKVHNVIYNGISPIPSFAVKKFRNNGLTLYVVRIDEGRTPPYITTKNGNIYERVSSGSMPIKDSVKLMHLYHKHEDQLQKVKNKIELAPIDTSGKFPQNICAYLDFGFSVVCSDYTLLQKDFYGVDITPISSYLKENTPAFSISRLAHSYLICLGDVGVSDSQGNKFLPKAGIHNFVEIMCDGSIKGRVILNNIDNNPEADISYIGFWICNVFKEIYKIFFGEKFYRIFVYAQKYEKLTVLKQFIPYYRLDDTSSDDDKKYFSRYLENHKLKYGNNLIVDSNRFPKNDYLVIDKTVFNSNRKKYNNDNLLSELFSSEHFNLGYIDEPDANE
ncbi:MAG: helix-turn-helix domain-containing protein [Porcipelethomonas sp.]